ncbi:MAG TPA: DUF429 domain-containing protein [Rubricoccaceae bacterium]
MSRIEDAQRVVSALTAAEFAALQAWIAGPETERRGTRASITLGGDAPPGPDQDSGARPAPEIPLAGIDGCRSGWYVVVEQAGTLSWHVVQLLADALDLVPAPGILAVDVPIGLLDRGDRACDREARRALAPRRSSSVFSAPLRPVLSAPTHADASARRRAIEGKRMSIQAFAIIPKIAEVDACLAGRPAEAGRVFEVHPEVTFARMNGGPALAHSKKGTDGRHERRSLLAAAFGDAPARFVAERPKRDVQADDVLDAFAALWTARRVARGAAASLPAEPPRDGRGLAMAIYV